MPLVDARAEVVRANDQFEFEPTAAEPIRHKIDHRHSAADRGEICGAWANIRVTNAGVVGCFPAYLHESEIERRRRIGSANSPAWRNHYEAMCKKTALHAAFKYAPKRMNPGADGLWEDDESQDGDEAVNDEAQLEGWVEEETPQTVSEYQRGLNSDDK